MTKTCEHEWVYENAILTSMPPQQNKICNKCGERGRDVLGDSTPLKDDYRETCKKFDALKILGMNVEIDKSLKNGEFYLKKPQKGCGKVFQGNGANWFTCGLKYLCPACKNQWKCKECGSNNKVSYRDVCSICYNKDWNKDNLDKVNKIVQKYRKNNPQKKSAWDKASREIEIKGLCQVCNLRKAEHRHHPDYDKPKDVILVCAKCHKDIHSPEQELNKDIINVTPGSGAHISGIQKPVPNQGKGSDVSPESNVGASGSSNKKLLKIYGVMKRKRINTVEQIEKTFSSGSFNLSEKIKKLKKERELFSDLNDEETEDLVRILENYKAPKIIKTPKQERNCESKAMFILGKLQAFKEVELIEQNYIEEINRLRLVVLKGNTKAYSKAKKIFQNEKKEFIRIIETEATKPGLTMGQRIEIIRKRAGEELANGRK